MEMKSVDGVGFHAIGELVAVWEVSGHRFQVQRVVVSCSLFPWYLSSYLTTCKGTVSGSDCPLNTTRIFNEDGYIESTNISPYPVGMQSRCGEDGSV